MGNSPNNNQPKPSTEKKLDVRKHCTGMPMVHQHRWWCLGSQWVLCLLSWGKVSVRY